MWPSYIQAPRIKARLPHNDATHGYLYYPQAGHVVLSIPYGVITHEVLNVGGTIASDSKAWISDWPLMIRFITSH